MIKIKPSNRNTNKHTETGMQLLENSINKVGVIESISVATDGTIISGHARKEIFDKQGKVPKEIKLEVNEYPVILTDIENNSKEYFEAQILANTTANKNFDLDIEEIELIAEEYDIDIEEVGVEVEEVEDDTFLEAKEDDFDATPPEIPITVLGDLYEIGEHRLLCGDSTCSDTVAKLMNGNKADMVVTDPPYGVNYDPKWREGLEHQRKGTSNGDVILNDNNADWSVVYSLFEANVIYVWHSGIMTHIFAESILKAGYDLKYLIIWNKDLMVLGRGDYHHKFEPCWYAVKKGEGHNWQGDRKQTTVWDIPTIHSFKNGNNKEQWDLVGHSCQKPLQCMIKPIENNSKINDLIADPFLGSGSTMVASHQLKRKCYGMELDPKYCDVIVKRMIKLDDTLTVKRNGVDCTNEFKDV